MIQKKKNLKLQCNFNEYQNWVHPDELKDFEKELRHFVYTKNGKLRKHLLNDCKNLNTKPVPEEFINTEIKKLQSAHRIHYYMRFRAYQEFPDVAEEERYQHTPRFYWEGFKKGCYTFFGIECCSCLDCCGRIIKDTQNPEAYSKFVKTEKRFNDPTVH